MVTVAQVLGLPGLGLEPVVEAATDLPVSWVVTSELADPTPYLEGGEVLLLTGPTPPPGRTPGRSTSAGSRTGAWWRWAWAWADSCPTSACPTHSPRRAGTPG